MSKIGSNNPLIFFQSDVPFQGEGISKMTFTAYVIDSLRVNLVLTIVREPTAQKPWHSVTRQTIGQMDTKLFNQLLQFHEVSPKTVPQRPSYKMPHIPRYQRSASHTTNDEAPPSRATKKTYHIKAKYQFINKNFTPNTTDEEILGLPSNFSAKDLKKAYNKLAIQFHPDKHEGNDLAKGAFQIIHEAYERLKEKE